MKGLFDTNPLGGERFETIHLLVELFRRLDFKETFHTFASNKLAPKLSPPLAGGDRGEGDKKFVFTLPPAYRQARFPSSIKREEDLERI
jgi:hypothetical protein